MAESQPRMVGWASKKAWYKHLEGDVDPMQRCGWDDVAFGSNVLEEE